MKILRSGAAALVLLLPVAALAGEPGPEPDPITEMPAEMAEPMPATTSATTPEQMAEHMAEPMPDAAIVAMITDALAPAGPAARRDPAYRDGIAHLELPMRPRIAASTAYDPAETIVTRRFVLNYNHSRDFAVQFPFDSFTLTPAAMTVLDRLGEALTSPALATSRYLIGGHTDAPGAPDYNQWLSERRAAAVRAYLIERFRIPPHRLVAVGFGEDVPLDPSAGASPRNRRVEVTLIEPADDVPLAREYRAPVRVVVTHRNVVCDSAPVALTDPRPRRHDLDDFGSPRTPVDCAAVHRTGPAWRPGPTWRRTMVRPSDAATINRALD
ncbi:OmpA family protein [Acuticoccus sp. 2012]|uniref:OmpA family protein n=2 Tax=Acuticoccus mangrovi TaxID=2796142 RepID=A0A934IR20_9HYPH|nr:OmpA family protein [Acuticoccus mangrovi]